MESEKLKDNKKGGEGKEQGFPNSARAFERVHREEYPFGTSKRRDENN